MKPPKLILFTTLLAFLLCSSQATSKPDVDSSVGRVKLNQLGYKPRDIKNAIVPAAIEPNAKNAATQTFQIIDRLSGKLVFEGELSEPRLWPYSNETVQQADFSALYQAGSYVLSAGKQGKSYAFDIGEKPLQDVHKAALKSFYHNRSAIAIDEKRGGLHAREAGHFDTKVKVHASAATKARPKGTVLSLSKGWYDAGDYGKYVVNSGISTYTLLAAYQHHTSFYENLDLNILESGDAVPDLIDEIKWNLDWLEQMQDLDGGVYHKLTALQFSDIDVSPQNEMSQRYVIGKSVTASLDYAAVMAVASRVFREFEERFPGTSERYKNKAIRAYQWAKSNPRAFYTQPKDVGTGAYDDDSADDEFAWAAAELFLLTGSKHYFEDFLVQKASPSDNLSWSMVSALAYISLSMSAKELLSETQYSDIKSALVSASEMYYSIYRGSAYKVAISESDFVWGSNGDVLNNGIILMQGYRLTGNVKYREAAMSTVDYVLGKNATGYSFVTGYGDKTPKNIHHRPSVADQTDVPIPGFIAGGPHKGQQDRCEYPSKLPAISYADTVCSYSTNEIAINWNAPLVYMLAAAISTD